MIRTALAALLLCAIPALHAETKKTTTPDKAPKTEKTTAADKKAEAKEKPAAKPEKAPAKEKEKEKPAKPAAAGGVDAADQALLDHANQELKKLTPAQTSDLLKLANSGTPEELQTIPGIGETRAAAIKKARPLKSADQLIMVDGVGEVTFDGVVKWVKDGMPKDAPAATKTTEKKPAAKTTEKTADKKPAAKTAEKTTEKKAADKTAEKPAEKKPAAKTAEKAADKKAVKP